FDSDSLVYIIPDKFSIEHLPENISISNEFGNFSVAYTYEDHKLTYVRKIGWDKGRYPKESYNDFRNFYRAIVKGDKAKVVFVDKT
ncbi:MAG: DUF3858 domain-containing protein, partial [Reichenbachiella sp.]